jgi:Protein of unknown function (DUF3108).
MKRLFSFLLVLLAAGVSVSARDVSKAALGSVQYEVRYLWGGINSKVADATISLEEGSWGSQTAYHSHVVIRANSIFRLFMSADYLVDSYLSKPGREPLYFINPVKRNGQNGKYEYIYDKAAKEIRSNTVLPPEAPVKATFPLDGKTMDLVSLLQYVRFQDIPSGGKQSMHVLMVGHSIAGTLFNEGNDTERYPGKTAERFRLKLTERGLMKNGAGKEIVVWCSTGTDRRILGLEVALSDSSTMVVTIAE